MKRKPKSKRSRVKTKLGLPDLEQAKVAVIVSLRSFESQRSYRHSIDEFVAWYCSALRLSLNKTVVIRYRLHLEDGHLAAGTINVRLAAARRLAYEAADSGFQFLLDHVSVQTSGKYFGCKQRLREGVDDKIGIERRP